MPTSSLQRQFSKSHLHAVIISVCSPASRFHFLLWSNGRLRHLLQMLQAQALLGHRVLFLPSSTSACVLKCISSPLPPQGALFLAPCYLVLFPSPLDLGLLEISSDFHQAEKVASSFLPATVKSWALT